MDTGQIDIFKSMLLQFPIRLMIKAFFSEYKNYAVNSSKTTTTTVQQQQQQQQQFISYSLQMRLSQLF